MKLVTTIGSVVAAAAMLMGCSVHSQAPIKQVAYDFSDYEYYDHPHAASPDYAASTQSYGAAGEGTAVSGSGAAPVTNTPPGPQFFTDASATGSVPVTPVRVSFSAPPPIAPAPVAVKATAQVAPPPEVTLPSPRGAGPEIQVYDARVYPSFPVYIGVGGPPGYGYGYGQRVRVDTVTHTEHHSDSVEHHESHSVRGF